MTKSIARGMLTIMLIAAGCDSDLPVSDTNNPPSGYRTYTISESMSVPTLSVGIGIEDGIVSASWSVVEPVSLYELEESFDETFIASTLIYSGTAHQVDHLNNIGHRYYRVRAVYDTTASRWSNIGHT